MRCECEMRMRCDAMGLDKSANANEKNFSHYHPWLPPLIREGFFFCASATSLHFSINKKAGIINLNRLLRLAHPFRGSTRVTSDHVVTMLINLWYSWGVVRTEPDLRNDGFVTARDLRHCHDFGQLWSIKTFLDLGAEQVCVCACGFFFRSWWIVDFSNRVSFFSILVWKEKKKVLDSCRLTVGVIITRSLVWYLSLAPTFRHRMPNATSDVQLASLSSIANDWTSTSTNPPPFSTSWNVLLIFLMILVRALTKHVPCTLGEQCDACRLSWTARDIHSSFNIPSLLVRSQRRLQMCRWLILAVRAGGVTILNGRSVSSSETRGWKRDKKKLESTRSFISWTTESSLWPLIQLQVQDYNLTARFRICQFQTAP